MSKPMSVGDRFSTPWPGTVISLLEKDGVVSCYGVRLDGAPEHETWLVPVDAIVPLGPAEEGFVSISDYRHPEAWS